MQEGTWLAGNLFHAYRLAERRTKQRGGEATIIEIDVPDDLLCRIKGRNLSTYRFMGGEYKVKYIHKMIKTKINNPCN